jgi:hypothetical protein
MSDAAQSSGSCFIRLVWFMIGPAAMLILAATKMERGGGWLTGLDIAFFIMLALTILARCIDFRLGRPQTASGTPATAAHLRRYIPLMLVIGVLVWTMTNVIGNR